MRAWWCFAVQQFIYNVLLWKNAQFKKQSCTLLNLKYLLPTASVNKKDIIIFASCFLILQNEYWILYLIETKLKYYLGVIGQHLSEAKWRNNNILPGISATFSVMLMTLLLNFWAFHTIGGTFSFSSVTYSLLKIFEANKR